MPHSSPTADANGLDALLAQVQDLTTTPAQLQAIAAHAVEHPELIAPLLAHPNVYPQLAQWLRGLQPEQDRNRPGLVGPAAGGIATTAATTTGLATTQATGGAAGAASTDAAAAAAAQPLTHATTQAATPHTTLGGHLTTSHIPPVDPGTTAATAHAAGTAAAGKTAAGIGAGKIAAGIAAVAVVAGGGTAGYIALNNTGTTDTTAQTAPSATAPAHASLAEDALRDLLETAPLTDNDVQLLGYPADSQLSYADSSMAYADTSDSLGATIDGTYLTPSATESAFTPLIVDVNEDGADDIVTYSMVSEVDFLAYSDLLSLVVYTPSAAGEELEILDALALRDSTTRGFSSHIDELQEGSNAQETLTGELTLGSAPNTARVTLTRGDWDPSSPSKTVTYSLIWQNGALALELLS